MTTGPTSGWSNAAGNSVTELNATTGALVRVIKGSSYKLHGTGHITSNGSDVWISNLRGTTLAELSATSGTSSRTSTFPQSDSHR